jgi:uncharacterized damage-inducible protein DinB
MTISEVLLLDYDVEIDGARRTLERIPEADPAWKPDEKSMPIGRLAMHVATLADFCTNILTTDGMDMKTRKFPDLIFQSTAHLLTELTRSSAAARAHLAAASDADLQANWKLSFGEKVFVDGSKAQLYRTMFFNHLIHHRAQLGVYLRLLKIPVPGLYGPSAARQACVSSATVASDDSRVKCIQPRAARAMSSCSPPAAQTPAQPQRDQP